MIKVIETNLSLNNDNIIIDHQSRIVEVENWDSYVQEFKCSNTIVRNALFTDLMHGSTIPNNFSVEDLEYDNKHLSCNIIREDGKLWSKKLAYKV